MRRVQVVMILILLALCAGAWGAFFVLRDSEQSIEQTLPTLAVLPSATDTPRPTPTFTSTLTATHTPTPTATFTATATPTTTLTPRLETHVLEIQAVMPGVVVPPTATPFPFGTVLLSAPPEPIEPLPDATDEPPPYTGWTGFESDHPLVQYATPWQARQVGEASRGQYHRSEDRASYVTFPFEGEGLRVRYVAAQNMGVFDLIVDGELVDTVDAYADGLQFPGTRVYTLDPGPHVLNIRNSGQKNDASEGYVVGLDAIQVFRGTENTLIIPPPVHTATPTPEPRPVEVELIAAPPQIQPTSTESAPQTVTVSVVIGYDENGNNAVDPAEGVAGVSIRAVETGTNQAIAQTVTDVRGYAELEITTAVEVRIVVPYFSEVWDLSRRRGDTASFTLLLDPGNQPGLIP